MAGYNTVSIDAEWHAVGTFNPRLSVAKRVRRNYYDKKILTTSY